MPTGHTPHPDGRTHANRLKGLGLIGISQTIGIATNLALAAVTGNHLALAAARFAIGTLIFLPASKGLTRLNKRTWAAAAIYASEIALYLLALEHAPLALVIAITALTPILTAGIERALGRTHLTRAGWLTTILATSGALLASYGNLTEPTTGNTILGITLALAATIGCSIGTVMLAAQPEHSPWTLTQAINITGTLITIPLALLTGATLTWAITGAATIAAIGGGGLAAVAFIAALRHLPASIAMAATTIGLPASAILGSIYLNEPITPIAGIGYILITSATLIAATKPVTNTTSHPSQPDQPSTPTNCC